MRRGDSRFCTWRLKRSRRAHMSSWTQPASYVGCVFLVKKSRRRRASSRAASSFCAKFEELGLATVQRRVVVLTTDTIIRRGRSTRRFVRRSCLLGGHRLATNVVQRVLGEGWSPSLHPRAGVLIGRFRGTVGESASIHPADVRRA